MNGICLIWSRGRLISPSLPVGDDKYLNLSSQKRPTGRNLGGNHLVRRSGTTSRGTVVLVFCLRMRMFPFNSSSHHIRGNLDDSRQVKILKKTTTLLNLQNMFRQKLLSSSVDRFTKR